MWQIVVLVQSMLGQTEALVKTVREIIERFSRRKLENYPGCLDYYLPSNDLD